MASVNSVTLIGRLTADAETKEFNGTKFTTFTVATNEMWTDKEGNKQERAEFSRVQTWGKLAEVCEKYLAKGKQVYVHGKLNTRSWEKDGQKFYATDIKADNVQFLSALSKEDAPLVEDSEVKPTSTTRKVKNFAPGAENDELGF